MRWFDFLFPPRTDEKILRTVSIDNFLSLMSPQIMTETQPGTIVLLPFHDSRVRSAIHEAKYHGSERAFEFLSSVLVEYLRDTDDIEFCRHEVSLIPVPLGKERMKERGFNQVEEVVRRAIRTLEVENKIKMENDLIFRARETTSQVSLMRATREKNMRGAFSASPKLRNKSLVDFARTTFIVVDDVITTGATLQAAIDVLKESGAQQIIPLALAH